MYSSDAEKQSISSPLINFYSGRGRTISSYSSEDGYLLHEIYNWSFDKLEDVHNYIQWLFPLTQKSAFNRQAPVLTTQEIKLFINDKQLKNNLIMSFKVMMKFYGFELDDSQESSVLCRETAEPAMTSSILLKKAANHDERLKKWLIDGNHNYLRITRILKSLKILGLSEYAQAFLNALNELYHNHSDKISARTHRFWVESVSDRINK